MQADNYTASTMQILITHYRNAITEKSQKIYGRSPTLEMDKVYRIATFEFG